VKKKERQDTHAWSELLNNLVNIIIQPAILYCQMTVTY